MLCDAPVVPSIPVTDLPRARRFYESALGLKPIAEPAPGVAFFACGENTSLFVYERPSAKTDHTLASFVVGDIEREVRELRERGVSFEEYDMPGLKTVDGIATMGEARSAWFRDPDGNLFALNQRPSG